MKIERELPSFKTKNGKTKESKDNPLPFLWLGPGVNSKQTILVGGQGESLVSFYQVEVLLWPLDRDPWLGAMVE